MQTLRRSRDVSRSRLAGAARGRAGTRAPRLASPPMLAAIGALLVLPGGAAGGAVDVGQITPPDRQVPSGSVPPPSPSGAAGEPDGSGSPGGAVRGESLGPDRPLPVVSAHAGTTFSDGERMVSHVSIRSDGRATVVTRLSSRLPRPLVAEVTVAFLDPAGGVLGLVARTYRLAGGSATLSTASRPRLRAGSMTPRRRTTTPGRSRTCLTRSSGMLPITRAPTSPWNSEE